MCHGLVYYVFMCLVECTKVKIQDHSELLLSLSMQQPATCHRTCCFIEVRTRQKLSHLT